MPRRPRHSSDLTPPPNNIYEPLDSSTQQIRLLWFEDGNLTPGRQQISIRLAVFDLDSQCPPYAALSYTWRSGGSSRSILLDGVKAAVGKNLCRALRACQKHVSDGVDLCSPPESEPERGASAARQYMWIDAISINQNDVNERNHQVQLMRDIYWNAARVIVWLGNECATSLRYPPSQPREGDPFLWADYWTRVWTAQEFELARDVWLASGAELIPLRAFDLDACFSIAYRMTAQRQSGLARQPSWTLSHRVTSRRAIQGQTVQHSMELFRDLESSNPRDTIYGMLGLIKPAIPGWDAEPRHTMRADYTVSLVDLCRMLLENWVEQLEIPQALAAAAA